MVYDKVKKMGAFETETFRIFKPSIEQQAENAVVVVDDRCRQNFSPVFGRYIYVRTVIQ